MTIVMYAPAMQEAIAESDLKKMKKLAKQAEEHLREWGDIRAALEILKTEIAKLEKGRAREKQPRRPRKKE